MPGIPNDADLLMAEMTDAANTAANGVCPICEEPLDPRHPKWEGEPFPTLRLTDGTRRPLTADEYAESVGPVADGLPYHQRCLDSD